MKKLLALMLALALALAGMTAAAAEDAAAVEAPAVEIPAAEIPAGMSSGSITLKAELNAEGLAAMTGAAGEEAAAQMQTIAGLVNSLAVTMTSDGKDAELIVSAKDQPVAGIGVIFGSDKLLLLSDLFPNYALAVDEKATGGSSAVFTPSGFTLTQEQIAGFMGPINKILEDMQNSFGEPEAVEEAMYGADFTVKVPVNLTMKEFLVKTLTAAKELVSQEGFTAIMEQLKERGAQVQFNPEDIDRKLEEIQAKPDEELPALDAAVYTNEAGDSIFVINVAKDQEVTQVNTGKIGEGFVCEVTVNEKKFHMLLQGSGDGTTVAIQAEVREGVMLEIDGDIKSSPENFSMVFDVKMGGIALGTVTITGTPNGVLTGGYTAEGKTELSIADMQDPQNEAAQGFMQDMQAGMMAVLGKAAQVVPEIITLMAPQTQTAPQE